MDDRSTNLQQHKNLFAATDTLLNASEPHASLLVINLCAANMPQAIDAQSVQSWGISGLERYKLYQVSRVEEGRRRYRVRLGFFTTEADAEIVLQSVRGRFASAFYSGLADEDLRHASGYLKKPLQEIQEIHQMQRTGRHAVQKITPEQRPPADNTAQRIAKPVTIPPKPVPRMPPAVVAQQTAAPRTIEKARAPHPEPAQQVNQRRIPETLSKNYDEAAVEIELTPPKPSPPVQSKTPSVSQPKPSAPIAKSTSAPVVRNNKIVPPRPVRAPTPPLAGVQMQKPAVAQKPAPAPAKPSSPPGDQHYHVASGRNIPDSGLSLAADTPATRPIPPQTRSPSPPTPPVAPVAKQSTDLPQPIVSAEALAKLRLASLPRQQSAVIPTLDSTQTIRTLTKSEMEDPNAPKWFIVQLAVSDRPANLDTMPRLDIFEAYRLYSIATIDGTTIRHALRLGFFRERVSAEAVMGYLKTFFGEPHIERVSDAEQKRFAERPTAANPQSQVITLEDKYAAKPITPITPMPPAPTAAPAATPPVQSPPAKRTQPNSNSRKLNGNKNAHNRAMINNAIQQARSQGLSETAIRRVEHSASLLSRLVNKLTK